MIVPSEILEQARSRIEGRDLLKLIEDATSYRRNLRRTDPAVVSRRLHLQQSEGAGARDALERVLGGNELMHFNYLARGIRAGDAVGRVHIRAPSGELLGYGTGFLIGSRVLLTNHHVFFPDEQRPKYVASGSLVEFRYELDANGLARRSVMFALRFGELFRTDAKLDYAVVAVAPRSRDGASSVTEFGRLPLIKTTGKVVKGEWVTIIQHPSGEPKQVALRENEVVEVGDDVITYMTDTAPGSSGSPVFNDSWQVIALHHSSVPNANGTKYVANEGVRISRILASLEQSNEASSPLLADVLHATEGGDAGADATNDDEHAGHAANGGAAAPAIKVVDGGVDLSIPLNVSFRLGGGAAAMGGTPAAPRTDAARPDAGHRSNGNGHGNGSAATDAATVEQPVEPMPSDTEAVEIDPDYSTRRGYSERFLGSSDALKVPLPDFSKHAADLAKSNLPMGGSPHVLPYHHFSVVHHARRKIALFTAVNIDGKRHYQIKREKDAWYFDRRIPKEQQLGNPFYASNRLDRGHLVRRLDPAWGSNESLAKVANDDTFHFTNCSPQHERFNQNQSTWAGVEDLVLDKAVDEDRKVTVFTGPVLRDDDKPYKNARLPRQYWKVVVLARPDKSLLATAFLLSQQDLLGKLEADFDAGAFKTFQVKVSLVEQLTRLDFGKLRKADVLGGGGAHEAAIDGAIEIDSAEKIRI
jgi:endonuclease G